MGRWPLRGCCRSGRRLADRSGNGGECVDKRLARLFVKDAHRSLRVLQRLVDPLSDPLRAHLFQQTVFDADAVEPLVAIERHLHGLGLVGGFENPVVHVVEPPLQGGLKLRHQGQRPGRRGVQFHGHCFLLSSSGLIPMSPSVQARFSA